MGLNFQDVIRDVHDAANHQLKVAASVSATNQVTVTPQVAWPDPKTYIGLVTVTGSLSASLGGNITLNPSPNFIGIVTVANPGSLNGNLTLDPGSKTGIVGNVTLSDSKGFIGLTTTVPGNVSVPANGQYYPTLQSVASGMLAPLAVDATGRQILATSDRYIGLVSVNIGGGNVGMSGNVTLDPGSKTGLVGTVTIQDGGNSITVDGSVGILGNVTLSDSKTGIGLVTVFGGSLGITGNVTLSDAKTYIGLVTSSLDIKQVSSAPANVTVHSGVPVLAVRKDSTGTVFTDTNGDWSPVAVDARGSFYTQIVNNSGNRAAFNSNNDALRVMLVDDAGDLVALDGAGDPLRVSAIGNITLSDSKGFIGLVTLGGGTAWTDPKTFIGLTTVVSTVKDTFASLATFTISIASLPTSTSGFGRQSTLVDNTTNKYTSAMVYLKVYSGGLAHTPNTVVNVYLLRRDNNSVGDDGVGASDATINFVNAPLLGNILFNASNISTAYYGVFDTAPLGPLGPQWGIGLVNVTGAALGGTEGNHLKNYIGINRSLG